MAHWHMTEGAQEERDALAESILLYAINTGDMYGTHCALAREKATINRWRIWCRFTVCRRYSREIEALPQRVSADMLLSIARDLKAYYEQHVNELV